MGEYFTYVFGVVTILAFIIQLKDLYPAHRETRRTVLLLVAGMFLGSLLGGFNRVDIKIDTPVHPISVILLIVLGLVVFGLAVISVLAITRNDPGHREELYSVLGAGVGLFFVVLVAAGLSFGFSSKSERPQFSASEYAVLSRYHAQRKNYQRAIDLLEHARLYLGSSDDPRRKEVEGQITRLREQMAKDLVSGEK